MLKRRLFGLLLVVGSLTSVGELSAHHSRAGVFGGVETTIVMEGVVVEVRMRNPHTFIIWDTKGPDGKMERWTGESSSVLGLIGMGFRKESLKPGDRVTATITPGIKVRTLCFIRKLTLGGPDGKVLIDSMGSPINQ